VPVDLRNLFLHLQSQLETRLQSNRAVIDHPGAKGAATEEGWREMLGEYLPNRYCVSKAFVIDADGGQSDEIDLVIYDRQYSPFLFKQGGAVFIPAESVYAVFEVKQDLTAGHVDYAMKKAASVRKLRRTSVNITHAGGKFEARPPFPILAGLLTLEKDGKSSLGKRLASWLEAEPREGRLDLLCALRHGSAEATYSEENRVQLDVSAPDAALIFFFLRLLERLQGLGTVPAINLREYGKALAR
jgi:uncharacterized protein DUF6602